MSELRAQVGCPICGVVVACYVDMTTSTADLTNMLEHGKANHPDDLTGPDTVPVVNRRETKPASAVERKSAWSSERADISVEFVKPPAAEPALLDLFQHARHLRAQRGYPFIKNTKTVE